MNPTFQDGGKIVVTLVDRGEWAEIRDKWCYVVVDTEGQTHFKRIKNRLSGEKGGFVVCTSDNPDKMTFPNFNLQHDEIAFVWFVEMYMTHKMPNIHDQYYSRLQNLEDEFVEMRNQFQLMAKRLK